MLKDRPYNFGVKRVCIHAPWDLYTMREQASEKIVPGKKIEKCSLKDDKKKKSINKTCKFTGGSVG